MNNKPFISKDSTVQEETSCLPILFITALLAIIVLMAPLSPYHVRKEHTTMKSCERPALTALLDLIVSTVSICFPVPKVCSNFLILQTFCTRIY